MTIININEYFFPVVVATKNKNNFIINDVYGTASYIGNGCFITAGHTVKNASQIGSFGIGYAGKNETAWKYLSAINHEIFEEIDLAIIKCNIFNTEIKSAKIASKFDPDLLADVYTCGFPHAYDKHNKTLRTRALKGYIVSYGKFFELRKPVLGYELSFNCPRGISGAPLMLKNKGNIPIVIGYIIGNTITEILVNEEREKNKDGNEITVYEKMETTRFGLAVSISELKNIESKLLCDNFYNYCIINNLLILEWKNL